MEPEHKERKTIGIFAYTRYLGDTFGGVEAHVCHLASYLVASGYQVVVHCLSASMAGWHIRDNEFAVGSSLTETRKCLWEFVPANGPGLEGCLRENVEAAGEMQESLILAFGTRDGFVFNVAMAAALQLGAALVSFVYFTAEERWYRRQFSSRTRSIAGIASENERNETENDGQQTLRTVAERSALIVVPTHYVKGQLSGLLDTTTMRKVVVSYHGVDGGVFNPGERTAAWKFTGNLLHVSRLSAPFACFKNYTWSCELIRALISRHWNARLLICGEGDGRQLIARFAEANSLADHLQVEGFVSQASLRQHYRNSDVLLVPSMMEAGCTVSVEAVMCGCLPLALDFAGTSEVMDWLGLRRYLVPGRVRALREDVMSIEPDMDVALQVLERVRAEPDIVERDLQEAKKVAAFRLSLPATGGQTIELLRARGLM